MRHAKFRVGDLARIRRPVWGARVGRVVKIAHVDRQWVGGRWRIVYAPKRGKGQKDHRWFFAHELGRYVPQRRPGRPRKRGRMTMAKIESGAAADCPS